MLRFFTQISGSVSQWKSFTVTVMHCRRTHIWKGYFNVPFVTSSNCCRSQKRWVEERCRFTSTILKRYVILFFWKCIQFNNGGVVIPLWSDFCRNTFYMQISDRTTSSSSALIYMYQKLANSKFPLREALRATEINTKYYHCFSLFLPKFGNSNRSAQSGTSLKLCGLSTPQLWRLNDTYFRF